MTKNILLYSCPRCGYKTNHKAAMKKHLYDLKKMCPALLKGNVDLTDEIKECVLQNRVWYPPPPPPPPPQPLTLNQTINNYNQMLNYVNKMDVVDKITKYVKHKRTPMIGFDQEIGMTYNETIQKLEDDDFHDFLLNEKDIIGIVDKLTKFTDVEKLNVVHDQLSDHIKIFDAGKWVSTYFDAGLDDLMFRLKNCYLDYYESFLLKRLWYVAGHARQQMTERLRSYYNFIVCFDLDPFVKGASDGVILGDDTTTYDIEESYYGVFCKVRDNIKYSDVKRIRKQITNIIKKNNKSNVVDLNSKMLDLMGVDEGFKNVVVQKIQDFVDHRMQTHVDEVDS